jgi:ABC-type transport system substrate-binding protein
MRIFACGSNHTRHAVVGAKICHDFKKRLWRACLDKERVPFYAAWREKKLRGLFVTGAGALGNAFYKTWGKDEVRLHPAGTGPFKLAKWEPNHVIVLEKNEHYFKKGLPYLERLEFKVMKDGVTRATALRAGEVDFANYAPREYVERLSKDPKLQVFRGRETLHLIMLFHNGRKPFDDVRVRQALAGYGIDRQVIAKSALLGQGQALVSFVPQGGIDHIDFLDRFPYEPDKAKALLKEAGFDEKNPLRYTLSTHSAEPALPTVATIIKTQLAQIGVDITVEIIDRPIWLRRLLKDRDMDQILTTSSNVFDPYSRRFVLDSRKGPNPSNHQDARVKRAVGSISADDGSRRVHPPGPRTPALCDRAHDLLERDQPPHHRGGAGLCKRV